MNYLALVLMTLVASGTCINTNVVSNVVKWIGTEMVVYATPFCYKNSYTRGPGSIPNQCTDSTYSQSLLSMCYVPCRSGYLDGGTTICLQSDCPSGYYSTGLFCQYSGTTSYVPSSYWDSRCTCQTTKYCCGLKSTTCCQGCVRTDSCRDGYNNVGGVCYYSGAWTITKDSYSRTGISPTCSSQYESSQGLCYDATRSGYSCAGAFCYQNCPSGTSACGTAACADSAVDCGMYTANMALAVVTLITSVFTLGAAAEVEGAAKAVTTLERAAKAFSDAVEAGGHASTLGSVEEAFRAAVTSLVTAAQKNLATVTNSQVASQVTAIFPKGTAYYNAIASAWTQIYLNNALAAFNTAILNVATSVADPSGIIGTIQAFNNPQCGTHTAFPYTSTPQ